jgi:hypothetical protein
MPSCPPPWPEAFLQRSAAEPDLVSVEIVVRGLAHAVRVGFPLHGVESPFGYLRDERIEVIDEERMHGVAGVLWPLHNECTRTDAPQAPTRPLSRVERMWAPSPAAVGTTPAPPRSRRLGFPRTGQDSRYESFVLLLSLTKQVLLDVIVVYAPYLRKAEQATIEFACSAAFGDIVWRRCCRVRYAGADRRLSQSLPAFATDRCETCSLGQYQKGDCVLYFCSDQSL